MTDKLPKVRPLYRRCAVALVLLLLSLLNTARVALAQGEIIYVNEYVLGDNDGTSWRSAFTKLQDALAAAEAGDQIWVAAGVYFPDEGNDVLDNSPFATFTLKSGVSVYGGFAGTERRLAQRDFAANITVLSGDVDGNDNADENFIVAYAADIVGENSVSVVTGSNVDSSSRMDGFVITAGSAIKDPAYCASGACGGGFYGAYSNVTLANLSFSGNRAYYGAGVYFYGASTQTLTDILFIQNASLAFGGGLQLQAGANAELTRIYFVSNTAAQVGGGAMIYGATATFEEATFQLNNAYPNGGGLYSWGGAVTIKNSIFSQNYADDTGGGIYADGGTMQLEKVQLNGNRTALNTGGGIYSQEAALTLVGVDFVENSSFYTAGALSVMNSTATTTLVDVTMESNSTLDNQGGWAGAFWQSGGTLRMANVTISRNSTYNLGGGVVLDDVDTKMTNVAFLGNYAAALEGDISFGGGMAVAGGNLVASNLLFVGNRGTINGALHLQDIDAELHSATFASNEATVDGLDTPAAQAIFVDEGSLALNNSIIWGVNSAPLLNGVGDAEINARYTLFQAVDDVGDTNNNLFAYSSPFQADPFAGEDGFGNDPNTPEDESANDDYGNLRLNTISIAIDAGSNDELPLDLADVNGNEDVAEILPLDLDNAPRITRYRDITARVDMGAYELQNAAPTTGLLDPYFLNEGGSIQLSAIDSSDDVGIVNYAWDCTDDGTVDVNETSPTAGVCDYPNSGNYTLRLTVSDEANATATATTEVTVANLPPLFTTTGNQVATVGKTQYFNLGSFTDPGAEDAWSVDIVWDDDYSAQYTTTISGILAPMLHNYMEAGTYRVIITISDGDSEDVGVFEVKVGASSAPPPPPPPSSGTSGTSSRKP